jgi:hypothetical protein
LKKLYDGFPSLHDVIIRLVSEKHQIRVEDISSWDSEDREAFKGFEAKLCRDFLKFGLLEPPNEESDIEEEDDKAEERESDAEDSDDSSSMDGTEGSNETGTSMDLVRVVLFNMVRQLCHEVAAKFGPIATLLLRLITVHILTSRRVGKHHTGVSLYNDTPR